MTKEYTSLGLMSGTSGDGVDASIIKSDGQSKYKVILDNYFKYSSDIFDDIHKLREKINFSKDLKNFSKEIELLEKKITLFHAKSVEKIIGDIEVDLIGFHGQTIFHNSKEKISKQLGNAKFLSQALKKNVIFNFRKNDLKNNGEGAPLAPIFHKLIIDQMGIKLPVSILNLGGIANITLISSEKKISSSDIGPGNCLIDKWIKINTKKNYDENGRLASSGTVNKIILDQALDNFYKSEISDNRSYDIKDFDLSFVQGLTAEDGAATLTEYTSEIISRKVSDNFIYLCGGGRKNKFLLTSIKKKN